MSIPTQVLIIVVFALLLPQIYPQCTSTPSNLNYMITGNIQLGTPADTFAKDDYNVLFSGSQSLGLYSYIFTAFSIIGFQTSSNQNHYSLTVDQVYLSNSNTVMKFTMDYFNNERTVKSQWNKVKLAYILVSPQFGGITTGTYGSLQGNSYVWATSYQHNLTISGGISNRPIASDPIFSHTNNGICGYIDTFPKSFGTDCPADTKIIYHYYIMGFRYDSTADNIYEFRASIRGGDGSSTNQNTFSVVIGSGVTPNGPRFTIENQNGNLKSIKIGVVITVIRDYATYPTQSTNPQKFKYSGVYMPVQQFNSPSTILTSNTQNLNRFDIGTAKFMFYGFSSISVQPSNYIDVMLEVNNLYSLQVKSQNFLNNVVVSGDFYAPVVANTCTSLLLQKNQVRSQQYSGVPSLAALQQTLNKISSSQGILIDLANQYVFDIYGYKFGSNQDTITMTIQLQYEALKVGKGHMLVIGFDELGSTDLPNGWNIKYTINIDGANVQNETISTDTKQNDKITKIGRVVSSASSLITITVGFSRHPSQDIHFRLNFGLLEISNVYDSVNQCCSSTCPAGSSINVKLNPYTCVSCNATAGQFYNPATAQCECSQGYYLVSQVSQVCVQCPGQLCAACNPNSPSICTTCLPGATLQFPGDCVCNSGLVAINNTCTSCSYRCSTCDESGKCLTCSDSKRNINLNCNCPDGFYDNQQASCLACNSGCKTCSSANVCTSCDSAQNKQLDGSLCVCAPGYYALADAQGNIVCNKCAPQCESCQGNAWTCTVCDYTKNKIPGYDSLGRLTCVCAGGYFLGANGSCSPTDCTKDPYCEQCSTDSIKICLKCKPSLNRILDTTSYKCVCQDGFYDQNGQCVTCPSACATCTNSSYCKTCVAGANRNGNTCTCQTGTFFTEQPTIYCKGCQQSCTLCNSNGQCIQCLPTYQLTLEGKCICGPGKYTTLSGECSTCSSPECLTCKNSNQCLTCISGYVLQEGKCISACTQGYYRSGSNCLLCSSGCNLCNSANNCFACNIGVYLYSGKCYSTCPPGSVAEPSTGKCLPCNSPCKTCSTHPSICTSCETNALLSNGKCVTNCVPGTFSSNGLCQYCDFQCATCLGSLRYCTSCPQSKYLYNGACYDYCPKYDSAGQCVAACSPGFYQSSNSVCSQCPSKCLECSSATKCTSCAGGFYAYLGDCVNSCPEGTFLRQNKDCIQCDKSCKTCQDIPTNCIECASGYVKDSRTGFCVLSQSGPLCGSRQYFNPRTSQCLDCNLQCLTCSNLNTCLSCPNGIIPTQGRCTIPSQCTRNCQVCSNNICSKCNTGFFLNNNECVSSCPYPLSAVNGQCRCQTGILFDKNCVTSCPNGYTVIDSECSKCDSNCKQCSEQVTFCTSCPSGFELNTLQKICESIKLKECPYGQYLADNGDCKRYCLNGLLYLNGLCYYTCINNLIDNGQGGCIAKSATSQCSENQFLLNGNCVNLCPAGYYGNIMSKKCENCPVNCVECVSDKQCTSCVSDYQLNSQNLCALKPTNSICSPGQYDLNGNCFSNCPITYFANEKNSKCEQCPTNCNQCLNAETCQICSVNHYVNEKGQCSVKSTLCSNGVYQLNGYCFNVCPVGYFANSQSSKCEKCSANCNQCTNAMTCTSCVAPLVLSSGICIQQQIPQPQTCTSGFYLNTAQSLCYPCRSPCATCSSETSCSTCISGYTLVNNQCTSTSCSDGYYKDSNNLYCLNCQSPCKTCTSLSVCTSCIDGYQLSASGACSVISSPSTGNLIELSGVIVEKAYRRGNSVIVSMVLPKMPSTLSQQQRNNFFNVKQSNTVNTIVSVTQWVPDILSRRVFVMVNFTSIDGSSFLFLSVNNLTMGAAYAQLGYSVNQKAYKAVSVYQTMQQAPYSIQVPISASAIPYFG